MSKYTVDEIEALIDYYNVRSVFMDKLRWLVRYCDLDRALRILPQPEREAIYYVGIFYLPLRDAGKKMGVSKDSAWKRYKNGLERIVRYLNTGKVKN